MKNTPSIIGLLVLPCIFAYSSFSMQSRRYIPQGFHTGRDFLDGMSAAERRAFIRGTYNGMLTAPFFGGVLTKVQELQKCALGMDDGQLTAIVMKYIKDRPADWHKPLNFLCYRAFAETCNFSWERKPDQKQ